MRVLIVTIAAVVVAVATAAAATPGQLQTGVWGSVVRGPITPMCAAEQPCTAPARHVQLLFSQSGQQVAQVTTDENGKYRLALKPGAYAVKLGAHSGAAGRDLEPRTVHSLSTRWVHVNFSLDTGIR
jgi:hypothetical protein